MNALADVPPRVAPDGRVTPTGWGLTVPQLPSSVVGAPDFGLLGRFSLDGGVARVGIVTAVLLVFTLVLSDFFDTMGTIIGVANEGGLLDVRGRLPGVGRVLFVDGLAAAAGRVAGASSNTTYIESAAGVGEGARTGLASVVTGLLFVVALFLTPLVTVVPYKAAAPVLVVGFLLMTQIRGIDWANYDIGIPAFLTIVLMPFTYSITNGIGAGFIAYFVIRAVKAQWRAPGLLMWIIALLFLIYFVIDPIEHVLGVR